MEDLCALRQDHVSNFITLLTNGHEKSIHRKCLEFLMIQVYSHFNGLPPQIIKNIFKLRKNIYNLRNFHLSERKNPGTKRYGIPLHYRLN